jgi:hypothetical protein
MSHRCRECSRVNPAEAVFCYFDGSPLPGAAGAGDAGSINYGVLSFPTPFVFPDGQTCRNFVQLALACEHNPQTAIHMLEGDFLEPFFRTLGRADLALAARAAARAPDKERGLDELLAKLPGASRQPPELKVEPLEKDLGTLPVGQDHCFDLTLTNTKGRLLYGKAAVDDCPWLALGDSGMSEKLFQFFGTSMTLPVRILGNRLRAYGKPQKAEIVLESNGGDATVVVRVTVPVKPFPNGVLSGALSPRQLAEKAKAHTAEAAVLIENGDVARWYEANGWTYPVQGPTASGIAAVQQLFEVLGLVKPPRVELREPAVTLAGKPGERLEYVLTVMTQEKRAAVAHGVSDQPWLTVGRTGFRGRQANIPLIVEAVPDQPNSTLTATVKVTANGNQRFDVPVTLAVGNGPVATGGSPVARPAPGREGEAPAEPGAVATGPAPAATLATEMAPAVATVAEQAPAPDMAPPPTPDTDNDLAFMAPAAAPARKRDGGRKRPIPWPLLLPVGIVVVGLLVAVGRDFLLRERPEAPLPEVDYAHPVLAVKFHDAVQPDDFVKTPSMRFGLGLPDPKDPKAFRTKLTYDDLGRTGNVCVRIGRAGDGYLWAIQEGAWNPMKQELGKDEKGNRLAGARSVWVRNADPKITVTQIVEIVPGGLSADGKKRLLDTCLVRYDITNDSGAAQSVGLRFLLDTFIGNNDAVPFTIAGARELCDTKKEFNSPDAVPDFISALERQDLENPGTVAHLSLKYGAGLEPPTRVTLGAWPASELRKLPGGEKAKMHNTLWDVPVFPMADAKSDENPNGDSAVTLYWDEKEIPPKQTRTVGFAYGLGTVTGQKGGGQLAVTAGGELEEGKEFTVTAYVKNPAPGATATLTLPGGLRLAGGTEKESVPALPPGAAGSISPVTWRVKALKGGMFTVKVTLNSGATEQYQVVVRRGKKNL